MNFHRISRTIIRLGAAVAAAALLMPGCGKSENKGLEVTEIIIIDPASGYLELQQGDGATIMYDVVPSEAIYSAVVEWSSDNEDVATVMNGSVVAYAPGNATITVKCGNVQATVSVAVTPVPVTSFTVPETLFLYTGYETVLEMNIEPEKANASSLDWEYDSEYLSMSFNEGKAVFTGLKKGNTTITVKSEKAGTKTVQVTIKDIDSRLIVGYNKRIGSTGNYKTIILKDGDEVIWDQICPSSNSYDPYYPDITVSVGPDISMSNDVTISCSNESICKEFRPLPIGTTDKRAAYTMYNGDGFGTADVTVTAYDKKFETKRKLQFKLTREAKGFPGELIVHGPKSTTIRNGDTYRMDKNTSVYFYVDDGYQVKWTVESGNALTLELSGDVYWSRYAKVTTADKTGPVTIKVTDQTGKTMSFTVNVTEQVFPDDIYVMYEDGTRLKDGDELLIGHEYKFKLSNSNYVGKWDFEGNTSYANYATEVVYMPKICRLASDPLRLTVKDKSGTVTKEYKLSQKYSLADCLFSINDDKYPQAISNEDPNISGIFYIPWVGIRTSNEIELYIWHCSSKETKKISPWQLSGADQTMNSGRVKTSLEYLSNGDVLKENNRLTLSQYYSYYKLTWKAAAGAFYVTITDGKTTKKIPFYSTLDVDKISDYVFFEFDYKSSKCMKSYDYTLMSFPDTDKASYNIMFVHKDNLREDPDLGWTYSNPDMTKLAYSTKSMANVVAIDVQIRYPYGTHFKTGETLYDTVKYENKPGSEVARLVASRFQWHGKKDPYYISFNFKNGKTSQIYYGPSNNNSQLRKVYY